MYPKLEELARELETLNAPQALIDKARNDTTPRHELIDALKANKYSYFAGKVETGYYDENYTTYVSWLEEQKKQ